MTAATPPRWGSSAPSAAPALDTSEGALQQQGAEPAGPAWAVIHTAPASQPGPDDELTQLVQPYRE